MEALAFGTPVLVRAEIARVVGTHVGETFDFKQKELDTKRYSRCPFKAAGVWPGAAIPIDWADTPLAWDIEPMPNGNALIRCRRIALQTPAMGLYLGTTRLAEGTLVERSPTSNRPTWFGRELDDRRWIEFYEIASPPTRNGRARITLVHPFDAQVVPLSMTPS